MQKQVRGVRFTSEDCREGDGNLKKGGAIREGKITEEQFLGR